MQPIYMIIAFCVVAVGLGIYFFYAKYRIVVGGALVDGEIIGTVRPSNAEAWKRGGTWRDVYLVRVNNMALPSQFGDNLPKSKAAMEERIGARCAVYFNPKHPTYVVLAYSWIADFSAVTFFTTAAFAIIMWMILFGR